MSKYVIIVDNGECYSDHCHWSVATTDTLERAKRLVDEIHEWLKKYCEAYRDLGHGQWRDGTLSKKVGPAPVPMLDDKIGCHLDSYGADFIEVPHYT